MIVLDRFERKRKPEWAQVLPAASRNWWNVSGLLTVRANNADAGCSLVDFLAEIPKRRVAMRGGIKCGS